MIEHPNARMMRSMKVDTFEHFKDIIHSNIVCRINKYRKGDLIVFPLYHGCRYVNRNGTRKQIDYSRGQQCVLPTDEPYWKENVKSKYKKRKIYFTRYMSNLGLSSMAKNKNGMWYNWRLKKFMPK